jgi:hypothetical protein
MRAEIVVYDELDAIAPFEVLSIAARSVELSLALVGADARPSVRTAHGLELRVPAVRGAPEGLIAPGGGWAAGGSTGVRAEIARGDPGRQSVPAMGVARRSRRCAPGRCSSPTPGS